MPLSLFVISDLSILKRSPSSRDVTSGLFGCGEDVEGGDCLGGETSE